MPAGLVRVSNGYRAALVRAMVEILAFAPCNQTMGAAAGIALRVRPVPVLHVAGTVCGQFKRPGACSAKRVTACSTKSASPNLYFFSTFGSR